MIRGLKILEKIVVGTLTIIGAAAIIAIAVDHYFLRKEMREIRLRTSLQKYELHMVSERNDTFDWRINQNNKTISKYTNEKRKGK